jgi:hypothetical protein
MREQDLAPPGVVILGTLLDLNQANPYFSHKAPPVFSFIIANSLDFFKDSMIFFTVFYQISRRD